MDVPAVEGVVSGSPPRRRGRPLRSRGVRAAREREHVSAPSCSGRSCGCSTAGPGSDVVGLGDDDRVRADLEPHLLGPLLADCSGSCWSRTVNPSSCASCGTRGLVDRSRIPGRRSCPGQELHRRDGVVSRLAVGVVGDGPVVSAGPLLRIGDALDAAWATCGASVQPSLATPPCACSPGSGSVVLSGL